ncbi:MAG: response regulator [Balneolaceae bacterium]|nr:response regulator [Balneolaceae bacterium]MCH8548153.1 response regulator [Balneolaceae bacterium]
MPDKKIGSFKVLIIDSQILVRQILANLLRKHVKASVTSTVSNEREKVFSSIESEKPDIILLEVNSIESDEMDLFLEIRELYSEIPVVLITPMNRKGAEVALKGIRHGAVDYITKPDHSKGLILATRHFAKRVPTVVGAVPLLNLKSLDRSWPEAESIQISITPTQSKGRLMSPNTELIVIYGCLGGVHSLFRMMAKLPADLSVPVVIVQHMPKIYTKVLAEELDKVTNLNVREAKEKSVLLPGQVYLAPGSFHTVVKNDGSRKRLYLHRGSREHRCRPSMDVFVRSAVQVFGSKILAVYLSGGGDDGLASAELILKSGGTILLENRKSSLVWQIQEKLLTRTPDLSTYPTQELPGAIRAHLIGDRKPVENRPNKFNDVAVDLYRGL